MIICRAAGCSDKPAESEGGDGGGGRLTGQEGPLKTTMWNQLWRTMHVPIIGALHSDTPLPSQHLHAALTQRVAVNLA